MYIHITALDINCIHVVNPKLVGREKKPMVLNHMQAKMMNWCSHFKRISGKVGIFLSRWQSRSCNEFPYGSLLIMWVYWSKSSRSTSPLLQLFNGTFEKKMFLNTFLPFEIQMFGLKFPFAPFSKSILEGACGCCIDAFAIQYLNLSLNETQMV